MPDITYTPYVNNVSSTTIVPVNTRTLSDMIVDILSKMEKVSFLERETYVVADLQYIL